MNEVLIACAVGAAMLIGACFVITWLFLRLRNLNEKLHHPTQVTPDTEERLITNDRRLQGEQPMVDIRNGLNQG